MKRIFLVADLGHASPRWVGYANALSKLSTEVHVFTPSMTRGQMKFLGVNLRSEVTLHQSASLKMTYKRKSHLNRISHKIDAFLSITKIKLLGLDQNQSESSNENLINAWKTEIDQAISLIKRTSREDIIISSSSPFDCHLIASELARKHDIPWFPDYRDLFSLNHNLQVTDKDLFAFEKKILKDCNGIITTSESFAKRVQGVSTEPIFVLKNGFEIQELRKVKFKGSSNLLYTGQIYPNSQNLKMFLDSICSLNTQNSKKIKFILIGTSSNLIKLYFNERGLRIPSWIKLKREVSRSDSWRFQANAGALLLFDWKDNGKGVPLTTKLYEYLYSGNPILLVTENLSSESISIIEKSATGFVCRSKQELEEALCKLANGSLRTLHPDLNYIETFSFDSQARSLLNWLDSLLNGSKIS